MQKNVRAMMDTPEGNIDLTQSDMDGGLQTENTFAPQINKKSEDIVRDRPVQDLLYDDALRRQDAHNSRVKRAIIEENSQKESKISNTNIEYLVHKFNREFEPIFEQIFGTQEGEGDQEEDPSLNYRQLGDLMYGMGYLSMSQVSEAEERILLSTMWSSLGGESNDKVPKEVIRAFLIAVEGVKITDGVKTDGPEEFGETKDGDFYPDCEKISKHFKLFYLNRIRFIGLREQPRAEKAKQDVEIECTFQPIISEATENYAQKYRQRIAEQNEGEKITVLDILTAQTNKDQWIEETKKDLEEKERKNCTFRPKTNKGYKSHKGRHPEESREESEASYAANEAATGDKCFDLYQLSIVKRKEKNDKTSEEVEFEKASQELTFQPNLYKGKAKAKKHKVNQRSVMDNIERMRRAREEREYKKKMTERGYNPGKAKKAMNHNKEKAPLQNSKPYNYQKKAVVTRPPEESTLYKGIGNFKDKPEGEFDEPSFQPKTNPMKRRAAPQPVVRRPAYQRAAAKPQTAQFQQRHHEEELEQMSQQQQQQLYHHEQDDSQEDLQEEEEESPEQPHQQLHEEELEGQEQEDDEEIIQDQHEEMGGEGEDPEQNEGEDGNPLLFVDVNLGPGRAERIVVYEGDTAEALAEEFTQKHRKHPIPNSLELDDNLKGKLVILLQDQIAGLLARIDEEISNYSDQHEQDQEGDQEQIQV